MYAIGDVIGPPGLASAAQQQGRFLADKLFASFRENVTPGLSLEIPFELPSKSENFLPCFSFGTYRFYAIHRMVEGKERPGSRETKIIVWK